MELLYLTVIILGCAGQNIFKKPFADRFGGKGVYFFNALTGFAALLFFVCTARQPKWDMAVIPYAIGFAAAYSLSAIFSIRAVACGPLTISSLVISYSLLVPTLYGIIFLRDPIKISLFPGSALLMASLFLVNMPEKNAKISWKWILYMLLAFIGNGMCSVIQNMEQVAFDGAYKNEFMILALTMMTGVMVILTLTTEYRQLKPCIRSGWYQPLICGVLNGLVNLLVMVLSARMPVSIMFPSISAGGQVATYLASRFFYREKLTKLQFIGFVLGVLSVIILNI